MALLDVGPFLEGVSSLQGKLEDAITKTRLLLEAIEGSQSKYAKLNEKYPVLRSLEGRLAASQGPNESLSSELVKFKLELESFVDEIFNSHDSLRRIRSNSLLQAKEVEIHRDKLWYEKGELDAERKRVNLEREELNALRLAMRKKPDEENTNLNRAESAGNSLDSDRHSVIEENNKNKSCDAECQTEQTCLVGETNFEKEKDSINMTHVECQTEPISNIIEGHQQIKKEQDSNENINKSFADEHTVHAERLCLLSSRSQTTCRTAVYTSNTSQTTHQRVLTAPVSRAKASLLTKQGHAFRIHKTFLDEVCMMKAENLTLKRENTALTKRATEINSELFYMKNQLTVNIAERGELRKKLHKSKEQIQQLEETLRKQAHDLVHNKKQQRQFEEEIKWSQIFAVPLYSSSSRSRSIPLERRSTKGR